MLVKLACATQNIEKKYLKNFCHDQQRWRGQFLGFVGVTPSPPPLRKILGSPCYVTKQPDFISISQPKILTQQL